ncbi:hypothetical protein SSBG_02534 [Streptomyces sp. SPB074]|nr:hypothetical protein SSBG_02534 [Streptomyces sp. SPB074]
MRRTVRLPLGIAAVMAATLSMSFAGAGSAQADANPTSYYYIAPPFKARARVDWWDFDPDTLEDMDEFRVYDILSDGHGVYAEFRHPNGKTYSGTVTTGAGHGGLLKIANLKDGTTGTLKVCLTENGKPLSYCQSWKITE